MEEAKRPDISKRMKGWWALLAPEERQRLRERQREGMRKYWAELSQEQRQEIGRNVSEAKKGKTYARKD